MKESMFSDVEQVMVVVTMVWTAVSFFLFPSTLWESTYLKSFTLEKKTVLWDMCFLEACKGEFREHSPLYNSIEVKYWWQWFLLFVARELLFSRNEKRFIFTWSINGISLKQQCSNQEKELVKYIFDSIYSNMWLESFQSKQGCWDVGELALKY